MDKIPRNNSVLWNEFKINMDKITIGKSVINGATAMSIPFTLLPFNVSEMTIVNKGPGATPAARPKVIP